MLKKSVLLLYQLFIISLIFGQLGRIPFPFVSTQAGAIYLNDLLLVILFGFWCLFIFATKRKISFQLLDILVLVFLATTLISLIFSLRWVSGREFIVGFFYWIRLSLYFSLLKITQDLMIISPRDKKINRTKGNLMTKTPKILEGLIILFALAGLMQFILFPDFSKYVKHGWDPHFYRVLSTFFDPNFAGLFLALGFLFLLYRLYRFLQPNNERFPRYRQTAILGYFLKLILVGVAIILTFSRSTYLAFGAGISIFAWLKDKRILVVLVILSVLAFAAIPRVRTRVVGAINLDETTQLRLQDYQKTIEIIKDYPVFGVGFNTFRYAQENYGYFRDSRGVNQPGGHAGAGADNSFLFITATGGVISLLTLIGLVAALGFRMWHSPASYLLLPTLATVLVHAQFVNSLFYPWILAWVMVLTGLYLRRPDLVEDPNQK